MHKLIIRCIKLLLKLSEQPSYGGHSTDGRYAGMSPKVCGANYFYGFGRIAIKLGALDQHTMYMAPKGI